MIPKAFIDQWKASSPWGQDEYVEQDLILSRILVELYSSDKIAGSLVFRGGTALHKLFLKNPYRYSEDLDFVQIIPGNIGAILSELRRITGKIIRGAPKFTQSKTNNKLIYSYNAEVPPGPKMKIKIEINTREHFAVEGIRPLKHECRSDWFTGSADIMTFSAEEMLATKLRALYQRKKGRDLFDLWVAGELNPDFKRTTDIFRVYLRNDNLKISGKDFADNLRNKIEDPVFLNDIIPLIRNNTGYNPVKAFEYVMNSYVKLI
ncbi:MAG: nucleotidyl transferase AbiEii/AbiGii toxin family protein [Ignavibacteria bacterium]|nr:nucleotidyl transferase AbiEii/AbiGii toxin family protein [Ignavibacteria bacterium]